MRNQCLQTSKCREIAATSRNSDTLAKVSHSRKARQFGYLLIIGLVILVAEYLLGILVNLYSTPPYNDILLSSHYALGVIILIFPGVVLMVMSARFHSLTLTIATLAALASIIVAGQAGRSFAFQGQGSIFSFVMAVAFLTAFLAYLVALFSINKGAPMR